MVHGAYELACTINACMPHSPLSSLLLARNRLVNPLREEAALGIFRCTVRTLLNYADKS